RRTARVDGEGRRAVPGADRTHRHGPRPWLSPIVRRAGAALRQRRALPVHGRVGSAAPVKVDEGVESPPRVAPASRPLDTERFDLLFRLAPALQACVFEAAVNPAARAGLAIAFARPAAGRLEEILSVVGVEIDTTSMQPGSVLLVEDDADIPDALTDVLQMVRWT